MNQTPQTAADQAYFEGQHIARSAYFWDQAEFEDYWGLLFPVAASAPAAASDPDSESNLHSV